MRKLGYLRASAIELLGLFGLHLGSECFYRRRIFFSHHHAWRTLRATAVFEWTCPTIRYRSSVGVFNPTFTWTRTAKFQRFVCRTAKHIRRRVVSKLVWIKLRLNAALLQRGFAVTFRNRSNQIDPTLRHHLDVGVLHRVAAVHQNLFWGFPGIGFDSFDPVDQLIAIVAGLSDIDS